MKIRFAPSLINQVLRNMLNSVSDGSLAPGTCVMQEHIAGLLAVSRQPAPQALQLPKKHGFF